MQKIFLICALLLLCNIARAQYPVMVKDINPDSSSYPSSVYVYKNKMLFTAASGGQRQMWASDGTAAGTFVIKDTIDRNYHVNAQVYRPTAQFAECNGKVFFWDLTPQGLQLWETDATIAGTHMLLNLGTSNNQPPLFTSFNGKLYFVFNDGMHGEEPWVTDGTMPGTHMLKDIEAGSGGSYSAKFIVLNGSLYFFAVNIPMGGCLWVSDGTDPGTRVVKQIMQGVSVGWQTPPLLYKGKAYFCILGINAIELWTTDGTPAGTVKLKECDTNNSFFFNHKAVECNGKFYFGCFEKTLSTTQLWVSDGTDTGTRLVKNIPCTPNTATAIHMYAFNNKLYFFTQASGSSQLWVSDGTDAGSVLFKDIADPGNTFGDLYPPATYNGRMYFMGLTSNEGLQLWQTDGNRDSIRIISPVTGVHNNALRFKMPPVVFDTSLYFTANYNDNIGSELYSLTTSMPVVGIKTTPALSNITVYPNPTKDIITIQYTLTTAATPTYRLYDINGRCVASWPNETRLAVGRQTKQLNISHIPPASYQLQVEANGSTQTTTVIKQ